MEKHFPFEFTLDDGTQVTVNKSNNHLYDFTMKPENGNTNRFTYNDNEEFTEAKEAVLSFDQLNALRRFWLLTRDEE